MRAAARRLAVDDNVDGGVQVHVQVNVNGIDWHAG
jgi:hypothetical protein